MTTFGGQCCGACEDSSGLDDWPCPCERGECPHCCEPPDLYPGRYERLEETAERLYPEREE
jgi:hypothetical protein